MEKYFGLLVLAIMVACIIFGVTHMEGGATHDARVAHSKQATITACSERGKYPVLDPNYAEAVYCSDTPVGVR